MLETRQMDEEIRQKLLTLLDQHRIVTLATLRLDGWPQATTVGCTEVHAPAGAPYHSRAL
jgi:hypothetical protein